MSCAMEAGAPCCARQVLPTRRRSTEHGRMCPSGGEVSIGGNEGFDANYEASEERARLARLALPDRQEAMRYLAALAAEAVAVVCLVLAATNSPAWLLLALPLGVAPGLYFTY